MATSSQKELPACEKFIVGETTSAGVRWDNYKERFDLMCEAFDVKEEKKKPLLIHYGGEEIFRIYSTFPNKKDLTYDQLCTLLTGYFKPKKCTAFEVHKFRKLRQKEGEGIDEFYTRLRLQAGNCEFTDSDLEIKMQIIQRCTSEKLRKKSLQESMTLTQVLAFGRSIEISTQQANEMSSTTEQVFKIRQKENIKKKSSENIKKESSSKSCFRCGGKWPHDGKCPAMGQKCRKCDKLNHFSKLCRTSEKVNQAVNQIDSSSDHI